MVLVFKHAKPRTAVHLHLFYIDTIDEFVGYLKNIPEYFDIYISCQENTDQTFIQKKIKRIRRVHDIVIRVTPNRGRDIAPFYALFREELKNYDYLLHIHSKKSLYSGEEAVAWRRYSLDGVLKDKKTVSKIFSLFDDKSSVGMVYGEPPKDLPEYVYHWLSNKTKSKMLLDRMGIPFEDMMFLYPTGSFFWARTEAIKPLFDLKLSYEDFDEEAGQIDGTLAHALERVVAWVNNKRGYDSLIFNPDDSSMSRNISYNPFKAYFGNNLELSTRIIMEHDVITFDLYDTLITRKVYKPEDIVLILLQKVEGIIPNDCDFILKRREAEEKALVQRGIKYTLNDIYDELASLTGMTSDVIYRIKELEIQTEYELSIPRRDVVQLFNRAKEAGKKTIIMGDSYLSSDVLTKILSRCGITGYDELWLSNEKGCSKKDGSMWDTFFKDYSGVDTINVGNDPFSDIQLLSNIKKNVLFLMSPRNEFLLSKDYKLLEAYSNTSAESSLKLGTLVNEEVYNSPYALKDNTGDVLVAAK